MKCLDPLGFLSGELQARRGRAGQQCELERQSVANIGEATVVRNEQRERRFTPSVNPFCSKIQT